ncbi:uncharacterized protein LOC104265757 [Ciona intestinalis]
MESVRGGWSAASRSVRSCFGGAMCCPLSSRRSNKFQLNVSDREVVTSPVSLLPPIRKIGDATPAAVSRASTEEEATCLTVSVSILFAYFTNIVIWCKIRYCQHINFIE